MADKELSALTAAGNLDGTELLHVVQSGNSRKATSAQLGVWRHDSFTVTAGTSGNWSIPAGVTEIKAICSNGSISAAGTVHLRLRQAADSADASFLDTLVTDQGSPTWSAAVNATTTNILTISTTASASFGGVVTILFPRSGTVKTAAFSSSAATDGQLGRRDHCICDVAEDHDQLKLVSSVNCTVTIEIFYR